METLFVLDALVALGIPKTAAEVAASMVDAGMAIGSIVTMLSGLGVGLAALRMALRAEGKKAIVA
ncbi:hypothetical protein [Halalkalibacter krulwichiae]|uniref:Carnocyclin-A n=1 Tax=Halalkalibacter krulwichiae TaxID=199441 RepID=A0A1X9MIA7_9BACI|nr:hypothetical protein [Halalkalibacter krulwichiae]ARK32390.1 Carnocyclin-A precursor [Halalkalibacter krulwichiae]